MTTNLNGQHNRRKPRHNKWSYIVPDLPGWDSLLAVTRYHRWAEIIGIIVLGLLVISEYASYRYGQRKDDLTNQQQQATDNRHDEEMARLHLENTKLQLDLERLRRPRNLDPDQVKQLIDDLRPFGPFPYDLSEPAMLEPGSHLNMQILEAFAALGWEFKSYEGDLPTKPIPFPTGHAILGLKQEDVWDGKYLIGVNSGLIGLKITFDPRSKNRDAVFKLFFDLQSFGFPVTPAWVATSAVQNDRVVHFPLSDVVHIAIGSK